MKPKSVMYVSRDLAQYLANNHSLAFKDGHKVHDIKDVIIEAEAYILLKDNYYGNKVYYLSHDAICGIVIKNKEGVYENHYDMRTGIH